MEVCGTWQHLPIRCGVEEVANAANDLLGARAMGEGIVVTQVRHVSRHIERLAHHDENALLRLPFKAAYMFRPGFIQPLHGVRSKVALYRWGYVLASPFFGLLRRLAPRYVTTSEQVGRAMLAVAKRGAPTPLVETADINALR